MTMMMLGLSGSHATSDPSLPLMFLLILLPFTYSDGIKVLESEVESAQFMEKLPITYKENLELLDTVLTLDEQWSPVWSEKLHLEDLLEEEKLNLSFCSERFEYEETVNTLDFIKWVRQYCSHSGMHVAFAVKLLGCSVKCLFYRNTLAQFTSITLLNTEYSQLTEYEMYLKLLIDDNQIIADRMVSAHVSLVDLIKWTKKYEEIKGMLIKYHQMPEGSTAKIKKKKIQLNNITNVASVIVTEVEQKLDSLCFVPNTDWYDFENKKSVNLNIKKEEVSKEVTTAATDQSSSSDLPVEYVLTDEILKKADELRKIFHKVFHRLLLGKLPLGDWKLIFKHIILVNS